MRNLVIKSATVLFAVLLILSLCSALVDPNYVNLSIFGLLFPYILLPLVLTLPVTYRTHKWLFVISLGLMIWGLMGLRPYIKPGLPNQHPEPDDASVTIMSYNAMMGIRLIDHNRVISSKKKEALTRGNVNDLKSMNSCVSFDEQHHNTSETLYGVSKFEDMNKR